MTRLGALAILIVLCYGCAISQDNQTTSTPVDVTGVWAGFVYDGPSSFPLGLRLQQTGVTVVGHQRSNNPARTGPVKGTIVGNLLSYRGVSGSYGAEFTVSGDEMRGYSTASGNRLYLRRSNSPG